MGVDGEANDPEGALTSWSDAGGAEQTSLRSSASSRRGATGTKRGPARGRGGEGEKEREEGVGRGPTEPTEPTDTPDRAQAAHVPRLVNFLGTACFLQAWHTK